VAAMTTERSQGLVITAFAVSGALVMIRDIHAKQLPPARFVVGTTVAAMMLATLAQVLPDLAGGLAMLITVSALVVYGGDAWRILSTAVGRGTDGKAKEIK
jgi:hypothetical protein